MLEAWGYLEHSTTPDCIFCNEAVVVSIVVDANSQKVFRTDVNTRPVVFGLLSTESANRFSPGRSDNRHLHLPNALRVSRLI